jgi:HEAT repeat protein
VELWRRLLSSRSGEPAQHQAPGLEAWLERVTSYSGFERQEAVEMLGRLRDARALPALLVRVNDWVPQVRRAALRAVRSLMDDAFVQAWGASLGAVVALARARRADHAILLEEVAGFLSKPTLLVELQRQVANASPTAKRYVAELEWRAADSDARRFQLLQAALAGQDIVLARAALVRLPSVRHPQQRRTLAGVACCSKFSPVRAAGLRMLLDDPDIGTPSLVRHLCLDESPTVRAIAWAAAQHCGEAPAAVAEARNRFTSESTPARWKAAILLFLCTASPAEGIEKCRETAAAAAAPLRKAALQMLIAKSIGDEQQQWLQMALADKSPKVQRLAVQAVRRGAMVPDPERVLELALEHGDAGALSRAFNLLRSAGIWQRIVVLLEALSASLPKASAEGCITAIGVWENDARNSFVTPLDAEARRLSDLWQQVNGELPASLRKQVEHHLTIYKINKNEGNND